MTPQAFAEKWSHSTLTERQGAQMHFIELGAALGLDPPGGTDPGSHCTFQRRLRDNGTTGAPATVTRSAMAARNDTG